MSNGTNPKPHACPTRAAKDTTVANSTPSPLEQELRQILAIVHDRPSARVSNILALIARHEQLLWERAWGIIANAGAVWDSDSAEAKEWREVARAFEAREAYGKWPAILPPGAREGEV